MLINDLLERNRAFVQGRVPKPLARAEAVSLAIVARSPSTGGTAPTSDTPPLEPMIRHHGERQTDRRKR